MSAPEQTAPACPRCRGGRETFHYWKKQYLYDVDRARTLAADGREPVEVEHESVRASVAECELDDFHVPHVDPAIPGLIAHIYHRTGTGALVRAHVLIDGHHRAARCLRERRPFFAYLLSERESLAILLRSPEGARPRPEETDPAETVVASAGDGPPR